MLGALRIEFVIQAVEAIVTNGPGFVSVISEAGVLSQTPFLIPVLIITLRELTTSFPPYGWINSEERSLCYASTEWVF